jgi:hypothetical protein
LGTPRLLSLGSSPHRASLYSLEFLVNPFFIFYTQKFQ